MSCYVITFELINTGRNYTQVINRIKEYGSWARISGFAYLISTGHTAVEVRDYLIQILSAGDKLYVGDLDSGAAWHGYDDAVSNWISQNQPRN